MKKPILVTSSHKSGTAWVGKMISLNRDIRYIHEPLILIYLLDIVS